jgi:restriction endonuclease Mrr
LLQEYNVKLSWNEYQAIKIHDGMYDEANKPYYVARSAQAKLKTNLPIILHHADHMAAQIEFERWRNRQQNTPKPVVEKTKMSKSNGLKNLAENNPDIDKSISDIFGSFNL